MPPGVVVLVAGLEDRFQACACGIIGPAKYATKMIAARIRVCDFTDLNLKNNPSSTRMG